MVADLQAGRFEGLRQRFNDFQIVRGVRSLPYGFEPTAPIFNLLHDIYQASEGSANVRSCVFSAAARLDELEGQVHAGQ